MLLIRKCSPFAGKTVRKDLLHQIKGGENVPSYVLEYLLESIALPTAMKSASASMR